MFHSIFRRQGPTWKCVGPKERIGPSSGSWETRLTTCGLGTVNGYPFSSRASSALGGKRNKKIKKKTSERPHRAVLERDGATVSIKTTRRYHGFGLVSLSLG